MEGKLSLGDEHVAQKERLKNEVFRLNNEPKNWRNKTWKEIYI
jgi:hypothetical protein